MFLNFADGLKNYFTFTQYVLQEPSEYGIFHFTQMNYPFGEYIFFTDNTPFVSLILKFINDNITDLGGNIIAIHNFIFIALLYSSSFVFYHLIKREEKDEIFFSIIIAIAIAWISPQALKFVYGVYNLSVALFLILALFIIKKLTIPIAHKTYYLKIFIYVFLLIVVSGLFHLYYIPILALMLGVFSATYFTLKSVSDKQIYLLAPLTVITAALIGGIGLYFFIQFIDDYSQFRLKGASGYDWEEWKFTPEAVISTYRFNSIQPLIYSCKKGMIPSESHGFWGNFTFYTILVFGVSILTLGQSIFNTIATFFKKFIFNPEIVALSITALVAYAISMGNYINLCYTNSVYTNYFSPFFYLYDKIEFITQFRCLGRFSWIGFWIVIYLAIKIFFKLYKLLKAESKKVAIGISSFLMIILLIDVKDAIKYTNSVYFQNLFNESLMNEKFAGVNEEISFSDYQAIYTIPFVNVGSEDYGITVDDQAVWTEYWMQLSVFSRLPLFNVKMSRTALNQSKAKIDMVIDQKVPELIMNKLNDQPVLVIYNSDLVENYNVITSGLATQAVEMQSKMIEAYKMDTLLEYNGVYFLSWDINNY